MRESERVRMRKREREKERKREKVCERVGVCVFKCARKRERKRRRERYGEREMESERCRREGTRGCEGENTRQKAGTRASAKVKASTLTTLECPAGFL